MITGNNFANGYSLSFLVCVILRRKNENTSREESKKIEIITQKTPREKKQQQQHKNEKDKITPGKKTKEWKDTTRRVIKY